MTRRGIPLAGVLLAAALTAGCSPGSAGTSLARQSCAHVAAGLASYHRGVTASISSDQERFQSAALTQLEEALPLASQAAEADGEFQALMTTLQDVNRVPIDRLVTALDVQCTKTLGRPVH